jgi:aminoglycoside phosphotransferase (APT) family kinase protein
MIRVYADFDGNNQARLFSGTLVEFLAKLHNIDAVLTQSGSDRRRRIRFAGGALQFNKADDFFGHYYTPP